VVLLFSFFLFCEQMTTKVEVSPRLALQYKWKMSDIDQGEPWLYSKKFMHQKTVLFQAGMKMAATHISSNPVILFVLTNNLQKMGLKIVTVT